MPASTSTNRYLLVRATSQDLFHAREYSSAQPPAGSVGIRSHTLLWASGDMSMSVLVQELGNRGWSGAEIEEQTARVKQNRAEI